MEQTEARQTGAVVFCALSAIGATLWTSMPPWVTVAASAVGLLLWRIPFRKCVPTNKPGLWGKAAILGAMLTCLGVLALGAQLASLAYPSADNPKLLGLLLLGVSVLTASRGGKAVLRTGAILFWFILIMYLTVGAFSVDQIYPRDISGMEVVGPWSLALALLPLAGCWAERPSHPSRWWRLAWAMVMVVPGVLCVLTLGPVRSAEELFSLYTLSKSVSILQLVERFEVLVSAAVTVGTFCLMGWMGSILLYRCQQIFGSRGKRMGATAAFLLASGCSLLPMEWLGIALAALVAIFWGIIPLMTQIVGKAKKL